MKHILPIALFWILIGQSVLGQQRTLFELMPSERTGFDFVNSMPDTCEPIKYNYIYAIIGGGVAVGDLNNDGLQDIVIIGTLGDIGVYANEGDLRFKRMNSPELKQTLMCYGVWMADVNGDGLLDFYISKGSHSEQIAVHNLLFINQGNFKFKESSFEYGIDFSGNSNCATFLDMDHDGDMDLLVGNMPSQNILNLSSSAAGQYSDFGTDRLYENLGNGKFKDVTIERGMVSENAFALATIAADVNQDGFVDIYVSNDFSQEDFLWINNGKGYFKNLSKKFFNHIPLFGMGCDISDYNNDGLVDVFSVDMMPEDLQTFKNEVFQSGYDFYEVYGSDSVVNRQRVRNCLQLNRGNNTFSEIAEMAGVSSTYWSWTALFADYNNDGWKDLYVTNGNIASNVIDYLNYSLDSLMTIKQKAGFIENLTIKERLLFSASRTGFVSLSEYPDIPYNNFIYENNKDLTFKKRVTEWGFDQKVHTNGAVYADLDNDGDLDIVTNNFDHPAFIYKNTSREQFNTNFFRIKCQTKKGNKDGIGTKAYLYSNGKLQYQELIVARGFLSNSESVMHFGLGNTNKIDSVVILWPYENRKQVIVSPKANQTITVKFEEANLKWKLPAPTKPDFFEDVTEKANLNFMHVEDLYVDFKIQPLLVHKISRLGPGVAIGDVNNDQLADCFIGGSADHNRQLFLQLPDATFKPSSQPALDRDKSSENMGTLFIDVDTDGDLDLYIANGVNSEDNNASSRSHALYLNDGTGRYSRTTLLSDTLKTNAAGVSAADYDNDGDLDLFIASRVIPGQFPYAHQSIILQNNKGQFTNVTATIAPALHKIGMVSQGIWSDYNNDGQLDLILVGQYQPLMILKNTNGRFEYISLQNNSLKNITGWWNGISGTDIDNDGDIDYVCGNLGLNSTFKATAAEPVSLFTIDYDDNGTKEPITVLYSLGKRQVYHRFNKFSDQAPKIKRDFLRVRSYAFGSLDRVISPEKQRSAYYLQATEMHTGIFLNQGSEKFDFVPLPVEAQFGPVFGIQALDLNDDPYVDLVLMGNMIHFDTESPNHDANKGLVLLNKGKGQGFESLSIAKSGFLTEGDRRALSAMLVGKMDKELYLLASTSNGPLSAFRFKNKGKATFVEPKANENYAEIEFADGSKRKQEFYIGSGYCAQSTPFVTKNKAVSKIHFFNRGVKRTL
jgi:enediyne biosynthesis protein E4